MVRKHPEAAWQTCMLSCPALDDAACCHWPQANLCLVLSMTSWLMLCLTSSDKHQLALLLSIHYQRTADGCLGQPLPLLVSGLCRLLTARTSQTTSFVVAMPAESRLEILWTVGCTSPKCSQ